MITSETVTSGPYTPNGVTTVFPFSFQVLDPAEIAIYLDGLLVDSSRYSVSLNDDGTGSATFSIPPFGSALYLTTDPAFDQDTTLRNQGPYFQRTIETMIDKAAMRDLWLRDKLLRAPVLPDDPTSLLGLFPYVGSDGLWHYSGGLNTDPNVRGDLALLLAGKGADMVAGAMQVVRPRDYLAVGNGVADDTTALQNTINVLAGRTLDGGEKTYKIASYLTLSNNEKLRRLSLTSTGITTRQVLFSGTAMSRNEVKESAFEGNGQGRALHATQSTTADVTDALISGNYAHNVLAFAEFSSARFKGRLTQNIVDTTTGISIRIGWNDYPTTAAYGPVMIDFNFLRNLYHGPLTYAPRSNVIGNMITNVGNPSNGAVSDGIYTKSRNAIVAINNIEDGGYGQGSINMKGSERNQTLTPQGFGIVCGLNNISFTEGYLVALPDTAVAIKCDASEQIVVGNMLDMGNWPNALATCFTAFQTGSIFDRLNLSANIFYAPKAKSYGVYLVCQGQDHILNGSQIFVGAATTAAVFISAQVAPTQISLLNSPIRGGVRGVSVNPGTPISATVTADSTTDIFTAAASGLTNDAPVRFSNSGGALPAPLNNYTTYYVINVTTNTFQVSATQGGAALDLSDNGSGTNTVSTVGSLDLTVSGIEFRDQITASLYLAPTKRLRRLRVTNNIFGGSPTEKMDIRGICERVYLAGNAGFEVVTTGASATTVVKVPTARDRMNVAEITVMGTDGTDYFASKMIVGFTNFGGTVVERTATSLYSTASGGAGTWTTTRTISGENVLVNVTGAASKTITWTVEVKMVG